MGKFTITETPIRELIVIEPQVFGDHRGFFMETYHKGAFKELGLSVEFVQDNHSKSMKGVLRGLHFQTRHPQGKLVRVTRGSVWDVAVDLRRDSATFAQWYGVLLTEENKKMFYVPEGFAHGFLTLEDNTEFQYKCTDLYYPECDAGIIYNDEQLGINWPFERFGLTIDQIMLSGKDKALPTLNEYLDGERNI